MEAHIRDRSVVALAAFTAMDEHVAVTYVSEDLDQGFVFLFFSFCFLLRSLCLSPYQGSHVRI